LLLANQHSLWRCAPETVTETIVAERLFSHIEFRHLGLGALPPPAAEEVGHPDPGSVLCSAASDNLPATAWASLAVASLRSGEPNPSANFRETQVAFRFARRLSHIAADQRHSGQFEQARQTADRVLAVGRLMVERNATDPTAYLMLADAFDGAQKNAWRPTEDRPAIELNLRRAVEAAQHAADLAPYDEVVRVKLERLQRKLNELLHP
jgi:hypothetical protein